MARDGTGGHCARSSTTFPAANMQTAYSFHIMAKGSLAPTTGAFRDVFGLRNNFAGGSNPDSGFRWDHSTTIGSAQTAHQRESGGTYRSAHVGATLSGGVWYSICETWDGTTMKIYIDGALDNSIAAAAPFNGTFYVNILAQECDSANGFSARWTTGQVGDAAMWNVALDGDEIVSLAKGFSPRLIRPASRFYWSENIRSVVEHHQGALNYQGTTAVYADHPRRFG